MSWAGFTAPSSSINLVGDIPPNPATSASLDTTCLPTLDAFIDPFLTFADSQGTSLSDMQLISSAHGQIDNRRINRDSASFDFVQMADICVCYSLLKSEKMTLLKFRQDTIRTTACL